MLRSLAIAKEPNSSQTQTRNYHSISLARTNVLGSLLLRHRRGLMVSHPFNPPPVTSPMRRLSRSVGVGGVCVR